MYRKSPIRHNNRLYYASRYDRTKYRKPPGYLKLSYYYAEHYEMLCEKYHGSDCVRYNCEFQSRVHWRDYRPWKYWNDGQARKTERKRLARRVRHAGKMHEMGLERAAMRYEYGSLRRTVNWNIW